MEAFGDQKPTAEQLELVQDVSAMIFGGVSH